MNIKNLDEEKSVSPNSWGSLEKTAGSMSQSPNLSNKEDGVVNEDEIPDEDDEEDQGKEIDLDDLDSEPENPYEEKDQPTENPDEEK